MDNIKTTYGIIKEEYFLSETSRISYGIAAYADAENLGTSTVIASVHDITSEHKKITELAKLCTALKLDADHLSEVVGDYLNGI